MMQSRQIKYFLAVADHLHLTSAADSLHISQPALSRSIHQLESRLGVPLFERLPTGVALTRFGEILARRARVMELEAEHTLAEIKALETGSSGMLRIGAGPVWLTTFLPPAIAALQRQHPGIDAEITGGVIDTMIPALLNGKFDMVCSSLDFPNHPELVKVHLTNISHVVLARKEHPLTRKKNLVAKDLLSYPWIALRDDHVWRNRMGSFFAARTLKPPKPRIVIAAGVRMLQWLNHGDYLASAPAAMLPEAERLGIVALTIDGTFWDSPAGVVYRELTMQPKGIGYLTTILKEQLFRV